MEPVKIFYLFSSLSNPPILIDPKIPPNGCNAIIMPTNVLDNPYSKAKGGKKGAIKAMDAQMIKFALFNNLNNSDYLLFIKIFSFIN